MTRTQLLSVWLEARRARDEADEAAERAQHAHARLEAALGLACDAITVEHGFRVTVSTAGATVTLGERTATVFVPEGGLKTGHVIDLVLERARKVVKEAA